MTEASSGSGPSGGGPRRRRRPALSCEACRRRKVRCDRDMPCSNCIRARDVNIVCTYQLFKPRPKRHSTAATARLSNGTSNSSSTPATSSGGSAPSIGGPRVSGPPVSDVFAPAKSTSPENEVGPALDERPARPADGFGVPFSSLETAETVNCHGAARTPDIPAAPGQGPTAGTSPHTSSSVSSATYSSLVERVRQLEAQLGEKLSLQDSTQSEVRGHTAPPGKFKVSQNPDDPAPVRGVVSKTRLFGTSHWMNGADLVSNFHVFPSMHSPKCAT